MATTQLPNKNKATARIAASRWPFFRHDFSLIKMASVVFICCTIVGALLIYGSLFLLEKQMDAVRITQLQANTLQEKLRAAEIDKHQINDFMSPYIRLVNKGFVGQEKRLNWIETIQTLQTNNAIPPITYSFAEQQLFQVDPTIDMGQLELRGSKITVSMDIFHEGELVNFLDGLKANHYYDLQSCDIKRLPDHDSSELAPLLHVECLLYWITLEKRNPSESTTAVLANS